MAVERLFEEIKKLPKAERLRLMRMLEEEAAGDGTGESFEKAAGSWADLDAERFISKVREIVDRKYMWMGLDDIIATLNPVLRGWHNYFALSNLTRTFWKLDYFITARFYRAARKASQRPSKIFKPGVYQVLKEKGLYSLAPAGRPVNA